MQYCISCKKVIQYGPQSVSLIPSPWRCVQDHCSRSKGGRYTFQGSSETTDKHCWMQDYSAQETYHLLLQLPIFHASRDFIVLHIDGSRRVDEWQQKDQPATIASAVDHYMSRRATLECETMTFLHLSVVLGELESISVVTLVDLLNYHLLSWWN